MATKAEIRNKVLRRLKVLPAGHTADSEDAQLVEDAYDELHALLSERELIYWGSTDNIPVEAVLPVVKLVADAIADDFLGVTEEGRRARLAFEAYGQDGNSGAFGDLQRLAAVDYIPSTVEGEYF